MVTSLDLIKQESADSVSSFTISDIFSANYDIYKVFIRGNGSQSVSSITAEFLDSGGSDIATGNYNYGIFRLDTTTTFGDVYGTGGNSFEFAYTSATDNDFSALITVYNPFSTSGYTFCEVQGMSVQGQRSVIMAKSSTSATSMKFWANQNFTPITVAVYGVKG